MWGSVGFLIATCWVIYTFVTPPEALGAALRQPLVEAAAWTTCPISYAGRYFPIHFWWLPPINAATYALVGLFVEMLRRRAHLSLTA